MTMNNFTDDEKFLLASIEKKTNPLCSPPRIKRLQNWKAKTESEFTGIGDENERLHQCSTHSQRNENIAASASASTESESLLSVQFFSTSLLQPPHSPAPYGDITHFRQRLKAIQERRVRHQKQSKENISLVQRKVHVEVGPGNNPIADPKKRQVPLSTKENVEVRKEMSHDDGLWGASSIDSYFPQNTSTVSTCQTFDETTIDLSTNATNSWHEFSPAHRLSTSSPITSMNSGDEKGGKTKTRDNARSLRRFLCTAPEKSVDTSFAQINAVRSNGVATNRSRSQIKATSTINNMNINAQSGLEENHCGAGFPKSSATLDIRSKTRFGQPEMNQSWCVGHSLSNPKHPHFSSVSFQPLPNDDDSNSNADCSSCQDEVCNDNTNYLATNHPSPTQRGVQQSLQTIDTTSPNLCHSEICSDESDIHRFRKKSDEEATIDTSASRKRNSSRFLWPKKDPWYVRSAGKTRECDNVIQGDRTTDEYMERIMHAVVFVKEKQT
mmetsp:Transcript_15867/g.43883  ORF Transcript_15867/g.43883 Transcript_15867/m.43883 type:complete len:497 (-) Transcript_15867:1292-2782(-)